MKELNNYEHFKLGLASPEIIRGWAERELPNGEIVGRVTKPYTIYYKNRKPKEDGLFCERIFGPIKSGVCGCGKYQGTDQQASRFCEQCGVEFTRSEVRRRQMGYIELAGLVAHIWYYRGHPSYISVLLKQTLEDIEHVVYYRV